MLLMASIRFCEAWAGGNSWPATLIVVVDWVGGGHQPLQIGQLDGQHHCKPLRPLRVMKGMWAGKAESKLPHGTPKYHPGDFLRRVERSHQPSHTPLRPRHVAKEN